MSPGPYRIAIGVAIGHLLLIGLMLIFGVGGVVPPTPMPIQAQLITDSGSQMRRSLRESNAPTGVSAAQGSKDRAAEQPKPQSKPISKQLPVVTPTPPSVETSSTPSQSSAVSNSVTADTKSPNAVSAGAAGAAGVNAPSTLAAGSSAVGTIGDASPRVDASFRGNRLPEYPAMSRRLGEQGVVVLRVFITPEGRAADVQLVRSSGSARLDRSAMETIREWRFLPARQAGRPVGAWYEWKWEFRLDG